MTSWYCNKKSEMSDALKPNIMKMLEKPTKKKIVCNKLLRFNVLFSSVISLTLIPVMYDKNAGNNGNTHGEIKDKNPAPNAKNILTSDKIILLISIINSNRL